MKNGKNNKPYKIGSGETFNSHLISQIYHNSAKRNDDKTPSNNNNTTRVDILGTVEALPDGA